jgi:hypothetical protein
MPESSNINITMPWSAMELGDLEHGLRLGVSLEVIADFIERDVDDVRQKADELGILPSWKRLPGKILSSEAVSQFGFPRSAQDVASAPSRETDSKPLPMSRTRLRYR